MSQPSDSICGGSWGLSWSPLLISIALLGLMRINTHLFHNVIDITFPFVTMLGGMIESSTQTTWWAILLRLLVMCKVLILIGASIILEILPAAGSSSEMLRTPTPASASVCLLGSLENMVYVRYHIVYDFVAVQFSDSGNSETDVDYIEVFVLYFMVQIL